MYNTAATLRVNMHGAVDYFMKAQCAAHLLQTLRIIMEVSYPGFQYLCSNTIVGVCLWLSYSLYIYIVHNMTHWHVQMVHHIRVPNYELPSVDDAGKSKRCVNRMDFC
jgi:hypothetical protein